MDVNLEHDLINSTTIVEKCKFSPVYSQNLYAAMANNRFFYGDKEWTCSWRYAGGLVSQINGGNDYMDYYCSGAASNDSNGFVPEGVVTDEIKTDLLKLGWIVKPYDKE